MANTRRNSQDTSKIPTATTALSNTSPLAFSPAKGNAYPILDSPIFVHVTEQNNNNNNSIINGGQTSNAKAGMLHGLPEMFTDIDLTNHNHLHNGTFINGDLYKSYVLGKFFSPIIAILRTTHSEWNIWQSHIYISIRWNHHA